MLRTDKSLRHISGCAREASVHEKEAAGGGDGGQGAGLGSRVSFALAQVGAASCGSCMLSRANMQRYWTIRSNESANSSPLALM
jgi:hypothetical protein